MIDDIPRAKKKTIAEKDENPFVPDILVVPFR